MALFVVASVIFGYALKGPRLPGHVRPLRGDRRSAESICELRLYDHGVSWLGHAWEVLVALKS